MSATSPPAIDRPRSPAASDQRLVVYGVGWKEYVLLREALEIPGLRMTYNQGALELMSPSPLHERLKTLIARLVETYAIERDVPLQGYGQTTFRREWLEKGLEPDECYTLGHPLADTPDLAIEVVLESGGLDKLPIYAGIGVPEVWFFERGRFRVFRLGRSGYRERATSVLVPGLDLALIAKLAVREDQHATVKAFQATLRTPVHASRARRPPKR